MSEAEYFWPGPNEPGDYFLECEYQDSAWWTWTGSYWSRRFFAQPRFTQAEMTHNGYLGVRREAEKPTPTDDEKFAAFLKRAAAEVATWPEWMQDTLGWWRDEERAEKPANTHKPPRNALLPDPDDGNAMVAQQALDEWRAVKQAPKAADWAYKWAVTLCEIAGAR